MNYNDETFYANENNVNDMNFEATSVPPVPNEEEVAPEDKNNGMRALGIAGAIVGSMGIGSAAAWGLYKAFNTSEPVAQNTEEPEEVVTAEAVPAAPQVVTETHIVHEVPAPAPAPSQGVEYVQLIETEVDGQDVIVGLMYDEQGHRVMLIDADHDGQFDIRATDVDNSGNFAQVDNLHTNGESPIMVSQFEQNLENAGIDPIYSYKDDVNNAGDEPDTGDLELTGMHQLTDEDGNVINVATVRMGERELMLVDPDNSGTFRYAVADVNGNGSIDDNEVIPLEQPIAMRDVAGLPHSDDYVNDVAFEDSDSDLALDDTYDTDDKVFDAEDETDTAEDSEINDYEDYVNNADGNDGEVFDAIDESDSADTAEVYDVTEDTDEGFEVESYDVAYEPEPEPEPEPVGYEAPDADYADTTDDYEPMVDDDFSV